jgi:hypothetical protein
VDKPHRAASKKSDSNKDAPGLAGMGTSTINISRQSDLLISIRGLKINRGDV